MNKGAVITGASGEIGQALCHSFAEAGYDIVAHFFKNEEKAKKLCSLLEEKYHIKAKAIKADFSSEEEIRLLAEEAKSFLSVDVLINNAGIAHQNLFQLVENSKAKEIFSVNSLSAMLLTKELLGEMIKRKSGRIINISSMWGVCGASCEVHYSASKAALSGFTKALAKEVGPSNITVNCIAPGLIDTKMNSNLSEEDLSAIVEETPMGRIGKPEDVSSLALFLAGEGASFITGQIITVDGGLT
ncbi:MAG: SDR family oxidoreductase [Clostridia bacterium]|nr:SDR family oxidoreductase [Clostridia bacterium]